MEREDLKWLLSTLIAIAGVLVAVLQYLKTPTERRRLDADPRGRGASVGRAARGVSGFTWASIPFDALLRAAQALVVAALLVIAVWVLWRWAPGATAGLKAIVARSTPAAGSSMRISIPPGTRIGDTATNPRDGAKLVWVPAGEFLMGGRDAAAQPDEEPQRTVYLDGFWMYRTEVTVAQYRRFCRATGRRMPESPGWGWKPDHPIVNVTWDDAKAYADWAGVALPTEAQWEKAARGTDGRTYPWGNEWDAGRCVNSGSSTQPVGTIRSGASPYGCLDMAGNVWEWCSDWYDKDAYTTGDDRNPKGPESGGLRVLRGGAWDFLDADFFRASYRGRYIADGGSGNGGFRCVLPEGSS